MNRFFQELRRRNVIRVAGLYAVVGWLLMQLAVVLETTLLLPTWFDTFITIVVLLGFPLALVGAWAFEMTPEGLKLTQAVAPDESISRKTGRQIEASTELAEEGDRAGAIAVLDDRLDDRGLSDLDRAALLVARARANAGGEGGDLAAAEADLQTALDLPGVPSWQQDEIVTALAELYVFQGKPEAALALVEERDAVAGLSADLMAMKKDLQVATGEIIPTDLADRPMQPVSTTAPRFPVGCSRGAPEYKVQVKFDVTAKGAVDNVRVVDLTDPCLAEEAVSTVKAWRFDPAVQSGYFVRTRDVPVTVTFS